MMTWSPAQKAPSGQPYKVVGYISPENLVDRVETWVEHPVLGDLHVETVLQELPGLRRAESPAPGSRRSRSAWRPSWPRSPRRERTRRTSRSCMTPPPNGGRGGGAGPARRLRRRQPSRPKSSPTACTASRADMSRWPSSSSDSSSCSKAPQSEARGLAIIAETKRLFPNKRIKYVVNTHPHFDHASGLAALRGRGHHRSSPTTTTSSFVEASLGSAADAGRRCPGEVAQETEGRRRHRQDGARRRDAHASSCITSRASNTATACSSRTCRRRRFCSPRTSTSRRRGSRSARRLRRCVQNIDRLQLDFERHVMVHAPNPDRPMTRADLLALAKGTN